MRDYVFIGWSRNRELAIELKNILDQKGFTCVIGGLYENNPEKLRVHKGTVNATINFQMNHCDQSIMLFQKIDDNIGISGNLIYELGYVTAQYSYIESATKLHIFKIDINSADENLFPTDLHGVWGASIKSEGKSLTEIAQEIACEFLRNQSQIYSLDKFKMLNDHNYIEYAMKKHFETPTTSEYDLAILMLIYVQSAFCYQEQIDLKSKIQTFRAKMLEEINPNVELDMVTEYALQILKLYCITIPNEQTGVLELKGMVFRELYNGFNDIGERLLCERMNKDDKVCDCCLETDDTARHEFESWMLAQLQEHITYLLLVYLNNSNLSEEEVNTYSAMGIRYCSSAIANLQLLSANETDARYAGLLLGYAYKNMSTFCAYQHQDEDVEIYRIKSYKERKKLYNYVNSMTTINPTLKDYITLEYLLQIVDMAKRTSDIYAKKDYMAQILDYITKKKTIIDNRDYMFNMLISEYEALKD